jgi:precorrin-2 dehydrogenase/sirohydrochlorin ferrochelatase
MLIDVDVEGKTVLVVGGGRVGQRKALKFLAAGAKVTVSSKEFIGSLKRLSDEGRLHLVRIDTDTNPLSVDPLISRADLVIAATDKPEVNELIAKKAKQKGILSSVVDNPSLGDFTLPVTLRRGGFHIAISTGGKSPAMASFLRKKIEGIVSKEDILLVRLQVYARRLAKLSMANQESRRRVLYKIIGESRIRRLLKRGKYDEAKKLVKHIIEQS